MIFTETKLKGAFILDIEKRTDDRGFFGRSWCRKEFEAHGLNGTLAQTNMSLSLKAGTLRGMHYQLHPYEESKLVRCVRGALYDVIIDLRPESATFKQWIGVELTQDNYRMLFVPERFAHGFITLTDNVEVTYQVSQFYAPGSESGIRYNDPQFGIQWPRAVTMITEKDRTWPDYTCR